MRYNASQCVPHMIDARGNLTRFHLQLSELSFEYVNQAYVNHQAVNALSVLPVTRADESSFHHDLSVLMASDAHFKGKHTETDSNLSLFYPGMIVLTQ